MAELAFESAVALARRLRAREVSSRELVDLYLDRIEKLDGDLNAYVHRLDDRAREEAARKDDLTLDTDPAELPPFHGVPVSIKDSAFLSGAPATLSTVAMKDFIAPFDDEPVARLLRAGMVPLGKTNAPELGSVPVTEPELFGPTRNPWDLGRTPGGSSGGAAASVAAGLCPVGSGADGGGSIRYPASNCGLVGLKPTRDRVSNAPLFGDYGFGLVVSGMLTRTVEDTAALLDVIAGYVPGDPGLLPPPERPFAEEVGRDPGRLRVGVYAENPAGRLAPEVRASIVAARQLLEGLGHETVDVSFAMNDEVVAAFGKIWAAVIASNPFPAETLEPMNRWYHELAEQTSATDYLAAQFRLQLFSRELLGRFDHEIDVLMLPVLTRLPLRIGELTEGEPAESFDLIRQYVGASPIANATGQPAISLPLHWDEGSGLPVGVQFAGRFADEATLIRLAAQLEGATPWADRRPPGFE